MVSALCTCAVHSIVHSTVPFHIPVQQLETPQWPVCTYWLPDHKYSSHLYRPTYHTSNLLKPSKQLQRLNFSEIYYRLCTIFFGNWTPFWDLLCTLCMEACNVYLPLFSVACDIKHVRIHGKWHSITSSLRFKPCKAWFKHVCSAVGHSSDIGFWHTVLFLKTHTVVLMVAHNTHNTQQLTYHDLNCLA